MRFWLKPSLSALAALAAALVVTPNPATVAAAQTAQAKPVPIDYFAVLDTMTNVEVSPDGKYLAYRLVPSKGANAVIQILKTDDLTAKPYTAGSSKMDITGFDWISNDDLWVDFVEQVRDDIIDTNRGVYENRSATLNRTKRGDWTFKSFQYSDMDLEARLFKAYPDQVIVSTGKFTGDFEGQAISELLTPDYYLMNTKTHRLQLKARAGNRIGGFVLDKDGDIRTGTSFEPSSREVVFYLRDKGSDDWREVIRWPALDDMWSIDVIGFDPLDLNKAFVLSKQGKNTTGVYLMDLKTGKITEEIYRRTDVDIRAGFFSTDPNEPGLVTGFVYYEDGKRTIAWIDAEEKALFDGLQAALPDREISITSRSMDGRTMMIRTVADKDPGSYYLFRDGKLEKIGSRNPLLKPEDLGEVSFIRWTARDGQSIPGYLTTPPRGTATAPFPLIVLPHGGPEVWEHVNYDEWAQMLANNGYMVLQPGYRGTLGYGQKHAEGIYKDWGGKPQNDKDDGALHLVRQGLVDPDRIAMFGWSYGGYAAMMASLRTPQIYQCAIAGAGVSDLDAANAEFSQGRITRSELKRTREGGISPVDHVADVNIPVLVVHGEHDQRVQINQSDWFVDQLKKNNKTHRYIVLEDADHFSATIDEKNAKILYTEMLSFLKNECGPGGL